MISTIWLAQNDYSEGRDSILQIVYLLGRNGVKWAARREGSKISLWKYHCETSGKLVAVMASTITLAENDNSADCDIFFSSLAIIWRLMGLSKGFTVRDPKCRSDDKHHNTNYKRWFREVW